MNVSLVPEEHLVASLGVLNAYPVQKGKPPYLIDLGVMTVMTVTILQFVLLK